MLTKGDDYPLHQTSEPIAFAGTDRNFYDRYFFNGYSADGSVFFAAAMGFYPQLGIVDASFCVIAGGVQHNLRASRRSGGERLDLSVGPIAIAIDEPLQKVTLRIAAGDGPLAAELTFTGRHFPIEEPRFIRRNGTRLFMDYTRMTQNGRWSGWLSVAGTRTDLGAGWTGTRDRSWGVRPVGAAEPQPPPEGNFNQFFWLWTPCNFDAASLFFHSNDDGVGAPWNRRGVISGDDGTERHFDAPGFATVSYTHLDVYKRQPQRRGSPTRRSWPRASIPDRARASPHYRHPPNGPSARCDRDRRPVRRCGGGSTRPPPRRPLSLIHI